MGKLFTSEKLQLEPHYTLNLTHTHCTSVQCDWTLLHALEWKCIPVSVGV